MKKQFITEIICGLLQLLFAYTALSKLPDFESFARTLAQSPLIGKLNGFVAWGIVVAELIIVFTVFFPKRRFIGLTGALFIWND